MGDSDPFAGIRLSEQSSSPKLDQRLFAREQPGPVTPPPNPNKTQPEVNVERSSPQPESKPTPAMPPPIVVGPASLTQPHFSLDDQPLHKASYLFTQDEQEALEDLKLELSREIGDKVFKNDLIRAALHMLVEDYRDNAAKSYIRRKVRRS